MKHALAGSFVLAAGASLLGGCVVMTGNYVEESGVRLSVNTLEQIESGRTTEQWIIATLGEPSARTPVSDTVEILRYEYSREDTRGGHLLLLFGGMTQTREATTTYFEMTNGVVTKYWSEAGVASRPGRKGEKADQDEGGAAEVE